MNAGVTDAERNKEITREYLQKVWIGKDPSAVHQYVDPDVILHEHLGEEQIGEETRGSWGIEEQLTIVLGAAPDLRFTLDEIVAERDIVAARWHAEATHTGTFYGIPPTYRPLYMNGMFFSRFRDGKVVESWQTLDIFGLMVQMGLFPASGPPAPMRWFVAARGRLHKRRHGVPSLREP
jgi:predicted ester cyclase